MSAAPPHQFVSLLCSPLLSCVATSLFDDWAAVPPAGFCVIVLSGGLVRCTAACPACSPAARPVPLAGRAHQLPAQPPTDGEQSRKWEQPTRPSTQPNIRPTGRPASRAVESCARPTTVHLLSCFRVNYGRAGQCDCWWQDHSDTTTSHSGTPSWKKVLAPMRRIFWNPFFRETRCKLISPSLSSSE